MVFIAVTLFSVPVILKFSNTGTTVLNIAWGMFVSSCFCHPLSYVSIGHYDICAFLGCYAVLSRSSLHTFRDNLSVPYSGVKKSAWTS
jgi:hypothetical protein